MDKQSSAVIINPNRITLRDALLAITAINQDLTLLEYANVIIRKCYPTLNTVRLLGGGIAETDLSHAVFVGRGMLTAAILGEDAVPGSRQILHTLKELTLGGENAGILIIVQANSDLFNFGLATDRANCDFRTRVRLLPVDDVKDTKTERYSCGYILLAKILGSMAEKGLFVDDIYKFYKEIVDEIFTFSFNFICEEYRGNRTIILEDDFGFKAKEFIELRTPSRSSINPTLYMVALLNVCKTLDRLNQLGLMKKVIEVFKEHGVTLVRLLFGSFLPTPSATLTILKLTAVTNSTVVEHLDSRCDATGWQQVMQFLPEVSLANETPGLLRHKGKEKVALKGPKLGDSQSQILQKSIQFACDALISCDRQLDIIDAERSDGNMGTRLKHFAEAVKKKIANGKLPIDCPYAFLKKLGIIAEFVIGSNMGTIYGMLLEGAANVFAELPEIDMVTPYLWAKALTGAIEAIKAYCPVDGDETTLYYPLKCCELAILQQFDKEQHYIQCYGFGVSTAEEAAQKTKQAGNRYPDTGAHAVGIWMRAIFEGVKLMAAQSDEPSATL